MPHSAAFAVSEATRVLCDRERYLSYSQFGEDRVIGELVDVSVPGVYVDVGCNDPIRFSNTLMLYMHGWRGVCIDGNPEMIEKWRKVRLRDRAVCAVVSDEVAPVHFHVASADVVSRVVEGSDDAVDAASTAVVVPRTLASILEENEVPRLFDVLSVDCEGYDLRVLRSFDIDAYQPRVVLAELTEPKSDVPREHPVISYLNEHGYRFVGFVGCTGIFTVATSSGRNS
jgi:FkbM family methyltransferase